MTLRRRAAFPLDMGRHLARGMVLVTALATLCGAASPIDNSRQLAALDCAELGGADVNDVLARMPAPRVIALHGSVPIVTMEPFAAFLEAMGYPAERLLNPADGTRSYGSFVDSRRLAGTIAWHYERDGAMPILIGHSQGGMVVIKVLHDLAGRESIAVWNPLRDEAEPRTTIIDPITRQQRPVAGLQLDYAAALATGSLPRVLLGQWGVLPLLRDVPDSVRGFTGFAIPWDPIAGTGPNPQGFRATGNARVRNVVLPASYSHVALPRVDHLARQPATRAWIEQYRPGASDPAPVDGDVSNLLLAAELWHGIKGAWCESAKRLVAPRSAGER